MISLTNSESGQSQAPELQAAGVRKKSSRRAKGLPPSEAAKVIPARVFAVLSSKKREAAERAAVQYAANSKSHERGHGVSLEVLSALPTIAGFRAPDKGSTTLFMLEVTQVHQAVLYYVQDLITRASAVPIRPALAYLAHDEQQPQTETEQSTIKDSL
jgi:hypothetical protein